MPTQAKDWREAEAAFVAAKEAKARGENVKVELEQTRLRALQERARQTPSRIPPPPSEP
jgi:hypothetical protein